LYVEGQVIEIVCQVRDGQDENDPGDGRPSYTVSAWDKLPTGDWVADLYTSLENKHRNDSLPTGVPACTEDQRG
jgi:hypothetical protein